MTPKEKVSELMQEAYDLDQHNKTTLTRCKQITLIIKKMLKRKFDSKTYAKMGHPDLGSKIYFMKADKKVWGIVSLLSFNGFDGAKNGLILLGLEPFKKRAEAS